MMDRKHGRPRPILGADDARRLVRVADAARLEGHPLAPFLLEEVLRAELRDPERIPADVVSMDSFVTYAVGAGAERRFLVYPGIHVWPPAEVSVLSPVGVTLLGLRAGDWMDVLGLGTDPPARLHVRSVGPRGTSGFVSLPKM